LAAGGGVGSAGGGWAAGAERHRGRHLHPGQRRFGADARHACRHVGGEGEHLGAKVDQQRVWAGVVGAQRLVVEGGGVDLGFGKGAAVEHDVARDALDAQRLHPAQQQPEFFGHQRRVATAAQVQVAVQHALAQVAAAIDLGAPEVAGAEQVEGCKTGHQLERGSGVEGRGVLVRQPRRGTGLHRGDPQRQRLGRQRGGAQRAGDGGRQGGGVAGCCGRGRGSGLARGRPRHAAAQQQTGEGGMGSQGAQRVPGARGARGRWAAQGANGVR